MILRDGDDGDAVRAGASIDDLAQGDLSFSSRLTFDGHLPDAATLRNLSCALFSIRPRIDARKRRVAGQEPQEHVGIEEEPHRWRCLRRTGGMYFEKLWRGAAKSSATSMRPSNIPNVGLMLGSKTPSAGYRVCGAR